MITAHPTSPGDISMTINLPVGAVTEMAARLESKESNLARKRLIPESTEQEAQKKSAKLASSS